MSLADYLAKNYLTADPPPESLRPKKKRKKTKHNDTAETGLIIADDDPPSLRDSAANLKDKEQDGDEDSPFLLQGRASTEFRKKKKSSWKTVEGAGTDEADAIIASAAAENAARQQADQLEDAPAIEDEEDEADGLRMESGARAGLQTAAQTAAMVAAQERKKRAELAAFQSNVAKQAGTAAAAQETIYRDASGRIINVAMKRAEARRAEEEAREKEERAKEALMGDVQRRQREERRQEIASARAMPLARTAEDEELNDELRAQDRWNDPAAQFLTSKKSGVSKTGKPLYKGAFTPNRYGIRPGHRWDGVDRSNGFEKEWFQARARKERISNMEYEWQLDV